MAAYEESLHLIMVPSSPQKELIFKESPKTLLAFFFLQFASKTIHHLPRPEWSEQSTFTTYQLPSLPAN